ALGKSVEEDCHLAPGRTIDQRPKAQAVGLHHVLANRHLSLELRNSVAMSRASSSTASNPCPWPLNTTSLALGISLIFSFSSSMPANGSRSPLRNRVGHLIRGQCSVRS